MKIKSIPIIITGAASGISKSAAALFVKHGANVVISDIEEEAGKTTVEDIVASGSGETGTYAADPPEIVLTLMDKGIKSEFIQVDSFRL